MAWHETQTRTRDDKYNMVLFITFSYKYTKSEPMLLTSKQPECGNLTSPFAKILKKEASKVCPHCKKNATLSNIFSPVKIFTANF